MVLIGRLLSRIIDAVTWIGVAAIILMMLHITFDVIGKFLFNEPLPATISLVSNYYMVVVAFIPLALVEKQNAHISVEVLTEFMPLHVQRHLFSWTYLISAAVFGLLAYRTGQEALKTFEAGSFMVEQGVKIVTWPSYFLLPLGTGLMTAVVIYRWVLYVTGGKSGLGETPTVPELVKKTAET